MCRANIDVRAGNSIGGSLTIANGDASKKRPKLLPTFPRPAGRRGLIPAWGNAPGNTLLAISSAEGAINCGRTARSAKRSIGPLALFFRFTFSLGRCPRLVYCRAFGPWGTRFLFPKKLKYTWRFVRPLAVLQVLRQVPNLKGRLI